MNKFCFLMIVLLSACTSSQKNEPTPISLQETQIAKDLVQGAFDDLWAGLDSTKILEYHTEDFVILENGEVWTNREVTDYMIRTGQDTNRAKRTNRMEFHSIEKYGPSITVTYDNYATFTRNDSLLGKGHWLESALIVNKDDLWRIKMMHSTWAGNE